MSRSTGTRIYVYRWPRRDTGERVYIVPETNPTWTLKLPRSIASFCDSPANAGPFLKPLFHFAGSCCSLPCRDKPLALSESVIEQEGAAERLSTFPLFLKATAGARCRRASSSVAAVAAGMRVLNAAQRDQIMSSVRDSLSASKFMFERSMARVISGEVRNKTPRSQCLRAVLRRKRAFSTGSLSISSAAPCSTDRSQSVRCKAKLPLMLTALARRCSGHGRLLDGDHVCS